MRQLLFVLALVANGTCAATPSEEVIQSCLGAHAANTKVSYRTLPNQEVFSQDDYKLGYHAPYYVQVDGRDIGYAEGKNKQALIYFGELYPLESAFTSPEQGIGPTSFNPHLAEWGTVSDARHRYLCTSFNFDGLGRSGQYQNVRAGYLLDVGARNKKLYFFVRTLRPEN